MRTRSLIIILIALIIIQSISIIGFFSFLFIGR